MGTVVDMVDAPSAVGSFMNSLADTTLDGLSGFGTTVLSDVNANASAFVGTTTLAGFTCWAALDCRSKTLFSCARVLQAWMPSYQE